MPDGTVSAAIPIRPATGRKTNIHWLTVALLFVATPASYPERAAISIAGPVISKDLDLNPARMGAICSAFGPARAIFNSAEYFATVIFALLMGPITSSFGCPRVFGVMRGLSIILTVARPGLVYGPTDHPMADRADVDYLAGGGLANMDQPAANGIIMEETAHG